MNGAEVKAWLKQHKLTGLEMAHSIKVSSNTVYKFIRGGKVHPAIEAAIIRYVMSFERKAS